MTTHCMSAIRLCLIFVPGVMAGACGGGSAASGPADTGNPPPTSDPVVLADAETDHGFLSDHFSGSQNCSLCHDGLRDATGQDVSIVVDWQATMMANSSRDPFWRAKVASEVRRNPGLRAEIEASCSRCHAPMAHVEAGFAAAEPTLLDDGFLHPDNPLFDAAAEGVSCTLCHQIADTAALGTDTSFSGEFEIPFAFGVDRQAFGQYPNPLTGPMRNQVAFTPVSSAHISSSEICATCHNLATTVVDARGNVTDRRFPEQMVYTEWENSAFAATQSCQDCHMPTAVGEVTISTRPINGGLTPRTGFARHVFVGANTYMLELLARNADELNLSATGFERLVGATRAFLDGSVDVAVEDVLRVGDALHFTVDLTNYSGHKFPTSYPSRRAWLHVRVVDAAGNPVFESGAVDGAGRISGHAADASLSAYEPHYEVIRSADQVQAYETVMEDLDGNLTHTLLRAAAYRKDNRLLPAGMDKARVPDTIRVHGNAATDPDFVGGGDRVRFEIADLADGIYTIEVDLNFQTLAYDFAADLARDADEPRVALFMGLHDDASIRFETIATASLDVDF